MKRNLLVLLLFPILASAQFFENFDSSIYLPPSWGNFRGLNNLGGIQWWRVSSMRKHSPNNSAYIQHEPEAGGTTEDWLVTPALDFTGQNGNSMSFYGGQQFTYPYGGIYTVRVSTTSQTDIPSFTTVATYYENSFSDVSSPSLTFKSIDLSAFDGYPTVYIAFVYTMPQDGDCWYVDDVSVTGTLANPNFAAKSKVALYPNPSSGIVNINSDFNIAEFSIYNVLGSKVLSGNGARFDVSNLSPGVYMAIIRSDIGTTFTEKIIKR